jgi:hypothetical protein
MCIWGLKSPASYIGPTINLASDPRCDTLFEIAPVSDPPLTCLILVTPRDERLATQSACAKRFAGLATCGDA